MRKFITLTLFLALFLNACGTDSQAENAGKAMAETACLLFSSNGDLTNLEGETTSIMTKYGWATAADIDTYLTSVRGTEEFNEVTVAARSHLEESCGEALTASGVSAEELANAMTSE
jgi:hypothetical protein